MGEKLYPRLLKTPDGRAIWKLARKDVDDADRRQLIAAARASLGPWVAGLQPWDLYVTLTYRQQWQDQRNEGARMEIACPSTQASRRHVKKWLDEAEEHLERVVAAFMASEKQQNGWTHWHGLICGGGLSADEFTNLSRLWFEPHGYAKFARVADSDAIYMAGYCSKYLCKEDGEVILWGQLAGGALPGQLKMPGMGNLTE
jgi:hypothetical protein